MEQITAVIGMFDKYGAFQVLLVGLFIFLVRFTPEVLDNYLMKRMKSIYAVYGVDGNHDIRLYSVFRNEKEAEEYVNSIQPLLSKKCFVISSEWKFGKKVPGLEAYNPYREEYFEMVSPRFSKNGPTRRREMFSQDTTESFVRDCLPTKKHNYKLDLSEFNSSVKFDKTKEESIKSGTTDYEIATEYLQED